jgi:DNA-binding CsgD family transcriptional regulator
MAIDTTSHVEASCTTQLLGAAGPVVARLGDDLRGTDVTVVVSDSAGRVVARRAPKPNEFDSDALRVGSVLPAYLDELPHVSIATAPITDARTSQQCGAVTLLCPAASGNSLLLPLATRAADEVELRLLEGRVDQRRRRARLGWASLTDAERSVAVLISEGRTNREAAANLFVSPHTIDAHLRHIFRKLDINSRVELASVVATRTAERATR